MHTSFFALTSLYSVWWCNISMVHPSESRPGNRRPHHYVQARSGCRLHDAIHEHGHQHPLQEANPKGDDTVQLPVSLQHGGVGLRRGRLHRRLGSPVLGGTLEPLRVGQSTSLSPERPSPGEQFQPPQLTLVHHRITHAAGLRPCSQVGVLNPALIPLSGAITCRKTFYESMCGYRSGVHLSDACFSRFFLKLK